MTNERLKEIESHFRLVCKISTRLWIRELIEAVREANAARAAELFEECRCSRYVNKRALSCGGPDWT